ncbi:MULTISPECIES: S41 family peptidase [Heyndrickxia]|uniref:C-terminal processing peptidase n=1 Tax=Heyndrickxia oleronia TaxID=38875 RepID=A0A8E2IFP2_9BACI|nr:S41 family peptidase [Heyndrickxia oleronia]NYV66248.1 PDZ domain-containing protein [Bacillus sp. Gen3]OJH18122.1 peptidase S41 [Bacillus obstructivus]MBU5212156.1 PDZ domain-containing protein [Heyndrickxia oleronia]MCI1590065.1 S41 family peptidase [Heyndrickxia oleronia]MCI1613756.1 S41 family peptidase [Heyndrickxia oleronia]
MKRKWMAVMVSGALITGASGTYVGMKWFEAEDVQINEQSKDEHFLESTNSKGQSLPDLAKIAQAYNLIKGSYVEEVDDQQLVEGAIQGMVSTLDDPYSIYMDAKTASKFNQTLESSFEGIGAEVTAKDGKILIVSPYKNSPAEKSGLKPKDEIIKIDGESIEGLDLYQATTKIRGKKGTTVTLDIKREGVSKALQFKVKRDEIPMETVFASIKYEGNKPIGYIEITQFSKDTAKDFKRELKKLEKQNMKGLIIDVRGNPGGLLLSVQEILDTLVTSQKPYYQIQQRDGEKLPYYSNLEKSKPYSIAVLVDEGSASASEILAGALKEAEGYTLIGEKTFGKGTVQDAVPMGDGSTIKLTMYKWLTPNGNWIHHKGIQPTIEMKQPDYFYIHPLEVEETLKPDMNNEQVKIAQKMLDGLGYSPGRSDGYYNQKTKTAVRAFQNQVSLPATGELDVKTAQRLEEEIISAIKDEKNDLQLQVALKYFQ